MRFTFLAAGIIAAAPAMAISETSNWKSVGGWDISFYSNLPGCLAYTSYEEGTSFFIGFMLDDDALLIDVTLMDDRWESIEEGKEYNVKVHFGDETPWSMEMTGKDYSGTPGLNVAIDVESDQAELFAEEFQRETGMKWTYGDTTLGNYTLRGSRAAFQETISCQQSFNEAVSNASDPFSGNGSGPRDPFAD